MSTNKSRVWRGGSWIDSPGALRSAGRLRSNPGYRSDVLGFRVVCKPKPKKEKRNE